MVADYDLARAEHTVAAARGRRAGDERFSAARVDASDADAVSALAREVRATHVFNAVDPRFVMPIFTGALAAGADYLDMAMSLSVRHPEAPYEKVGVKLGDEQFARAGEWEAAGRLALLGIGVEPGLSDVFARYAADELFDHIDELGTRDGANLVIRDDDGNEVFAPGSRCGRSSRSASTRPWCGSASAAVATWRRGSSRCRPSPSPRSSTSPRASARSSACTSSTRRCSSCRAGSRPTGSRSSTAWARR